jgi:pectate lyase
MFTVQKSGSSQKNLRFTLKSITATAALIAGSSAFAAATGGFSTTDGGNVSGAKSFSAATYQEINTIIANAKLDANGSKVTGGAYPVIITYTGNEDSLIATIVKDQTVDANGNCPKPHWNDAYRFVEVKEFTKGVTILGANGSSANFGVVVNSSSNVIIRNMKIGALGGANNDADMIRIDSGTNVLVDHNELFAVDNECNGSPDGDLTFESAIDIKKASHNVTVSYNFIHDSKKLAWTVQVAATLLVGVRSLSTIIFTKLLMRACHCSVVVGHICTTTSTTTLPALESMCVKVVTR